MLSHPWLVLALLGAVSASPIAKPVRRWTQNVATCRSFYADIYAEASNVDLASVIGGTPTNQQVLVQSEVDEFAAGSTVMKQIMEAPKIDVSGNYEFYFEYCEPVDGNVKGVFQTHHGIVANAGYWNVELDGKTDNSFAESAVAAGWATLSYDRLGVGNSSHPDGINVVQISLEIAQSIGIAQALRNGYLDDLGSFSTIVGVGHSYGSNLVTGVTSVGPDVFDAVVLTGFTNNATLGPLGLAGFESTIASVAYPVRFSSLSNAYVITPSISIDQKEFFHYPNYTQSALDLFTTDKSEYSIGQLQTIPSALTLPRQTFNKPVLVLTGENDAPYCAANCLVTSLGSGMTQLDTVKTLFPAVDVFQTYVVPATGHGINYHTTAYEAYQQIIHFILARGL